MRDIGRRARRSMALRLTPRFAGLPLACSRSRSLPAAPAQGFPTPRAEGEWEHGAGHSASGGRDVPSRAPRRVRALERCPASPCGPFLARHPGWTRRGMRGFRDSLSRAVPLAPRMKPFIQEPEPGLMHMGVNLGG
jgi:hypothetical protein